VRWAGEVGEVVVVVVEEEEEEEVGVSRRSLLRYS
jgi:hypothetical protein